MEIKKFVRKPFEVEAVQVTEENIAEVAAWCNGEVHTAPSKDSGQFIKVRVRYPLNERQTQAFVGDWVLSSRRGYKVYTDSALGTSFVPSEESIRNVFDDSNSPEESTSVDAKDAITGKRR